MGIHYGNNEYQHLIGKQIKKKESILTIVTIYSNPDEVYINNDGYAGNAYTIVFSNNETMNFRYMIDVLEKYGELSES
jgi:hypothetical protein